MSSFSTSSIASSARRVRERRRMEQELQLQKQQQQVPLLAPRSPISCSSSSASHTGSNHDNHNHHHHHKNRSSKSPRSPNNNSTGNGSTGSHLLLSDMEPMDTTREGSRSISPQSMMMSMSSVVVPSNANSNSNSNSNSNTGRSFGSPPGSPRVSGEATNTSISSSHLNNNNNNRPIFLNRRPPMVSPTSPQQRSRSWDEGESLHRPPSPSMRSTSPLPSWTLQPKLQSLPPPPPNQSASSSSSSSPPQRKLQPRSSTTGSQTHNNPRIVAELGNFPVIPLKSAKHCSFSIRRVNSTPTVSTETMSDSSKTDDYDNVNTCTGNPTAEGPDDQDSTELLGKSQSVQPSSSGEDESLSLGGSGKPPPPDESKNTSPALSSVSSFDTTTNLSTIRRLCHAIQSQGPRPPNLSIEEKMLWDTMQRVRQDAHQEGLRHATRNEIGGDPRWDTAGFEELREQAVSQQLDNSRSLQAIQRILSDVQLQDYPLDHNHDEDDDDDDDDDDHHHHVGGASSTKTAPESPHDVDLQAMSEHIVSLERELLNCGVVEPVVQVTVEPYGSEYEAIIERLEQENEELLEKVEWKDMVIEQLEKQVETVSVHRGRIDSVDTAATFMPETPHTASVVQIDEIRSELSEKSAALENAKMIIASLENASGSLAADLKRKLGQRNEEMKQLRHELSAKQRTLDTLATELRDVQKAAAAVPPHHTEAAQVRRLQLSSRLETNLAEIRAAAVILESTQDATAVTNLSELLSDSACALRDGIDVIENGLPDERRGPLRLHKELEEKNRALNILEDKLRAQVAEASRYRITSEDMLRRRDKEISALHAEVKILRHQCTTNMEVLSRKERELAVLRDSLRVDDDDGVGYISDDDDADDDDDDDQPHAESNVPESHKSIHHLSVDYGPTQAAALATLLSHTTTTTDASHSFDSGLNHRNRMTAVAAAVDPSVTTNEELESVRAELTMARTEGEKAQRQLMVEKESLSNAKMIISSLDSMMEGLRTRLQDSNTAIASLLEKSMESERTSALLRSELDSLKQSHYVSEPDETHLMLEPPPQPLLLTETID